MDNKIVIRIAEQEDSKVITQILSSAFQEFKENYTPKAFEATVIEPEKVVERMSTGIVWIVSRKNEAVGTVSGKILNNTFYIQGMAVVPKGRDHKIGYLLLKTIEDYAIENKCQNLLLNTTPYLTKAIRLYKKFGFQIINEPPYDLFGTPLFNMKKFLK